MLPTVLAKCCLKHQFSSFLKVGLVVFSYTFFISPPSMELSFLEGPGSFVWIIITVDFSVSCEGYLSKMTVFV